jgi:hypothetical protein
MENGKLPDLSKFQEMQQPLVITLYPNINFGVGPMHSEIDGSLTGVMFEWFVPATPWDRKRIPFDRLSAVDLATKILGMLDLGAGEPAAQIPGTDEPSEETTS